MNSLSEKVYIQLESPSENNILGYRDRIIDALNNKYTNVVMPYEIMKNYIQCAETMNLKLLLL